MRDSIRKRCDSISSGLISNYSSWKSHHMKIAELLLPRHQQFSTSTANNANKGMNSKIIDPSATMYLRTAAGGMFSGITNPTQKWIRFNIDDKDKNKSHAVRLYLDKCAEIVLQVLANTNFYNASHIAMKDILAFSTSSTGMQKSDEKILRFFPNPVGSYTIANDSDLLIGTHQTTSMWTAERLVKRFGENEVSDAVRAAYRSNDYKQQFELRHVVFENPDHNPRALSAKHAKYSSVYYEVATDSEQILSRSGFHEFPFLTPRWEAIGSDAWGSFSPGMIGLGQVRGLQSDQREKYIGMEMKNKPPMVGPSSLKNAESSTIPGSITYVDNMGSGNRYEPAFLSTFDLNQSLASIADTREMLKQVFFHDLFLAVIDVQKSGATAYEIAQRKEEKMIMLGPVLMRFDEEFLNPAVSMAFNEADRRGMLPEPPQELHGESINIQYMGMLHQAQRAVGIASIERTVSFVGNFAGLAPEVMDKINVDATVDVYADITGTTPEIFNDEQAVAGIRENRAKQQQAQQMAAMAQPAQQGAQAAKLLSDVDVDSRNGLTNMLGMQ